MLAMFPIRPIWPFLAALMLAFAPSVHAAPPPDTDAQAISQAATVPAEAADKARLLQTLTQLEPQVRSLLVSAVTALKQGIENGPPFLIEERRGRIERLEKLLRDTNADLAEQFRRVMDAYRVELDYAKTVDAYRGLLKSGKEERLVDFLSIGRLALYYQTLDGYESGIWREDTRQRLSGEGNEAVAQGLRTARKLEPPQLIVLPLPASKTGFNAQAGQAVPDVPATAENEQPAQLPPAEVEVQLETALAAREGLFMTVRESAAQLKPYYQQTLLASDADSQRQLIDRLADERHRPEAGAGPAVRQRADAARCRGTHLGLPGAGLRTRWPGIRARSAAPRRIQLYR
ncbi:MAG: DUF3450 domain-containing protein [Methylobacter sp.]|uniref:DUF3450 family protein n=1 Tax=Methylobacter sp. TaxID=2051955 RepID=UPI00258D07A8|nr:DUF3450 family protein [Methylobacter sp.]MCL7421549.1 DUF3450 domain-containing protein [Methylobacter sp.]